LSILHLVAPYSWDLCHTWHIDGIP